MRLTRDSLDLSRLWAAARPGLIKSSCRPGTKPAKRIAASRRRIRQVNQHVGLIREEARRCHGCRSGMAWWLRMIVSRTALPGLQMLVKIEVLVIVVLVEVR